ncbi:leucyl aminopeptidase family protein [Candidatus Dependentiae bacterium]|nr:leucyl aminopeptidase family protein [Candidatus Dependentiae bacterium]
MVKFIYMAFMLACFSSVVHCTELRLWKDDSSVTYDAVFFILNDKTSDSAQLQFLKRLGINAETLSFCDQMTKVAEKDSGNIWLPSERPLLFSWASLPSILQKNREDAFEQLRALVGKKLRNLIQDKIKSAVIVLPENIEGFNDARDLVIKELAIATHLATYNYSQKTNQLPQLERIDLYAVGDYAFSQSLHWGNVIGYYTNLARRWGDAPAGSLTPQLWAQEAAHEAGLAGCSSTILDVNQIRSLNMGGILGVGSGVAHQPVMIVTEYKPEKPIATIAITGKGIIFDSGGLQLKSTGGMLHMKFDKCGGAAALATCFAAAKLQAHIRVIALVPAVFNKTGSNAMHPRDILHMMNGKTVEVNNTDAEGRLILADALCYAEKFYNPDVIIDVATLTGACVAALGSAYSGLMSRDERLKRDLIKAGAVAGDRVWELPLDKIYEPANASEVADVSNCGKGAWGAGAIVAGLFLSNFVQNQRWAHIDIAGPAQDVPHSWYGASGATGAGVRLLIEYITNYRLDDNAASNP